MKLQMLTQLSSRVSTSKLLVKQQHSFVQEELLNHTQHNNGGIRIDSDWQTNIKGLYACGEAAGSLGIFRPGGTALNSCQVGSLRAAEHIAYKSENTVSESFDKILEDAVNEANALIEATRADASTLISMNEKYSARMSQYFAFLRDIPSMEKAKGDIKSDIESFTRDNKWKNVYELFLLFKNLDIIRMEEAIAETISYTAKNFGSRGSGFVLEGTDFMDRCPIPEEPSGREKIVTVTKRSGIEIECVPVRPIPKSRDLWFEKVWGKYRALTEK